MKTTELRDISEEKLRDHIATARRDMFGLRMQHATGELDNTARLSTVKRDLARALTVARQRGVDPNAKNRGDNEASPATKTDEAANG
jgi:large subunit ribosomal protein L29